MARLEMCLQQNWFSDWEMNLLRIGHSQPRTLRPVLWQDYWFEVFASAERAALADARIAERYDAHDANTPERDMPCAELAPSRWASIARCAAMCHVAMSGAGVPTPDMLFTVAEGLFIETSWSVWDSRLSHILFDFKRQTGCYSAEVRAQGTVEWRQNPSEHQHPRQSLSSSGTENRLQTIQLQPAMHCSCPSGTTPQQVPAAFEQLAEMSQTVKFLLLHASSAPAQPQRTSCTAATRR